MIVDGKVMVWLRRKNRSFLWTGILSLNSIENPVVYLLIIIRAIIVVFIVGVGIDTFRALM